jgi:hypothetical protein
MRTFTLAVLAALGLAAAPVTASAATIDEGFSMSIGDDVGDISFASLPGFDPKLGTLLGLSVSLAGPATWIPTFFGSSPPFTLIVFMFIYPSVDVASQEFGSDSTDP